MKGPMFFLLRPSTMTTGSRPKVPAAPSPTSPQNDYCTQVSHLRNTYFGGLRPTSFSLPEGGKTGIGRGNVPKSLPSGKGLTVAPAEFYIW